MVRFGNSGSEVTMHSLRLARAVTGRNKIIKMEGGYHGGHDAVSVSVKPKEGQFGDPEHPTPVVSSLGVLKGTSDATLVAPFNNLPAVERLFAENPGEIAAVIVEPIMMNIAFCMPDEGYLQGLRELTRKHGALFIMDEVKTGGKLAYGGACEYFNVKPDIVCLGKSIGGGFPLAAFAASREMMDVIAKQKMFHAGTYNTNPVVMAAGIATFREVLTRDAFDYVGALEQEAGGWLQRDHRRRSDWSPMPTERAPTARLCSIRSASAITVIGITSTRTSGRTTGSPWSIAASLAQPYWWDEQWTISVQHTAQDIEEHLQVFAEVAPALAAAQEERMTVGPSERTPRRSAWPGQRHYRNCRNHPRSPYAGPRRLGSNLALGRCHCQPQHRSRDRGQRTHHHVALARRASLLLPAAGHRCH